MQVQDQGAEIVVTMAREEFFLVQSLMSEALETGDDCDFDTRVGATKDEVRSLLRSLPDLPLSGG
ncbi:hypothetical protein GCM10010507_60610 [Streptomyces cinnamoneus]|uniref:Uncharacterized protein n=1 Tax=Streptomyces cinnamoneus TaxID=53446 RepID=A0A918U1X6_STRCJ|nr:hypothetical protein GCM10010507_60610 [Streptomyces cinnamoneus]